MENLAIIAKALDEMMKRGAYVDKHLTLKFIGKPKIEDPAAIAAVREEFAERMHEKQESDANTIASIISHYLEKKHGITACVYVSVALLEAAGY